jgi:hypothetical protein
MGDGLMFGLGQRIPREIAGNYGPLQSEKKGAASVLPHCAHRYLSSSTVTYVSESYIGRPDSRQRPKTLKSAFPSAKLGTDA